MTRPIISGFALLAAALVAVVAFVLWSAWNHEQRFIGSCESAGGVAVDGAGFELHCLDVVEVERP